MCEDCLELIDDPSRVPDDVILYRRVRWDQIGGRERWPIGQEAHLSGNAFSDYSAERAHLHGFRGPCMSVGISSVLENLGLGPEAMLTANAEDFGVAGIEAGHLRALTRKNGDPCPHGVMAAPTTKEPWHGVVFCGSGRQRNSAEKQAIADRAFWVIPLVNTLSSVDKP